MFIELVESNRKAHRSAGGAIASVALHTGLIVFAIAATANARTNHGPVIVDPTVIYVPQRTPDASASPAAKSVKPVVTKAETMPAAAPTIAPIAVTTGIPDIGVALPTPEPTWTTGAGSPSTPVGTEESGEGTTGPLTAFEVDKAVRAFRTNRPPTYPDILRAQGIEGEVIARYVVDESGRVDMTTVEVVSATSPAFSDAVRSALQRARFQPAEAAGRKVAQLVEQRFQFRLN